jgi:hypothetical protein
MRRLSIASLLLVLSCRSADQSSGQDFSAPHTDAATHDSAATDSASSSYDCNAPPSDLASCSTAGECGFVARGCYCGQQPVTGVARRYLMSGMACETAAASSCALGCAVQPGQKADDGNTIPDGTSPSVACDSGMCRTHVP